MIYVLNTISFNRWFGWCFGDWRSLRQFWPLGISQVIIVELCLLFDFLNLLSKFVMNVFPDEFWGLEFLSAECAEPLVFINFLAVRGNELFHLIRFCLET